MRHGSRDAHFRVKARERGRIFRHALWQKFDRDDLAQLQIFRAIHLAHAAASGERDDAIAIGDDLSGNEATAADRVGTRKRASGSGWRAWNARRRIFRNRGRAGAAAARAESRRSRNARRRGRSSREVRTGAGESNVTPIADVRRVVERRRIFEMRIERLADPNRFIAQKSCAVIGIRSRRSAARRTKACLRERLACRKTNKTWSADSTSRFDARLHRDQGEQGARLPLQVECRRAPLVR